MNHIFNNVCLLNTKTITKYPNEPFYSEYLMFQTYMSYNENYNICVEMNRFKICADVVDGTSASHCDGIRVGIYLK